MSCNSCKNIILIENGNDIEHKKGEWVQFHCGFCTKKLMYYVSESEYMTEVPISFCDTSGHEKVDSFIKFKLRKIEINKELKYELNIWFEFLKIQYKEIINNVDDFRYFIF